MFVEDKAKGEVRELDQATRLLLNAASLLERVGHCKGIRLDGEGRHCVLGAIDVAAGYDPENVMDESKNAAWHDAVNRIATFIYGDAGEANWRAAKWNNAPERTAAEVISTLRTVAFSS